MLKYIVYRRFADNVVNSIHYFYRVYCQIGGYPDVVDEWVTSGDIELCLQLTESLLARLYRESSRYFGEIIGSGLWAHTLNQVAAHRITKSGNLDITLADEVFRSDAAKGFEVRRKDKINALKWLEECRIVGMAYIYDTLGKVMVASNKYLFYFRDMGLLTQLARDLTSVAPSDIAGMIAENFVYLHLRNATDPSFSQRHVGSYRGSLGQIDFIIHNKNQRRFGLEVKHGSGSTKSGNKALEKGEIDYLIRIQDTYGSIGEKQATIPIFMLDKLQLILGMK